jgi:protein SCO1
MSIVKPEAVREHRRRGIVFVILLAALAAGFSGCKKEQPAQEQVKRYKLVGKIVEVQAAQNTLIVDGQEIPGFMAAMTMPYPVRDPRWFANLGAGDEITADVVVASDGAYLENIVVTKKGTGSKAPPATQLHEPQPGEAVPDFALVNQDGKRIHLREFRGSVLLVTFIYTRCPFPNFCPLVSRNFAEIYAATKKDPALHAKVRLLSVSFDPEHDTPAVLRNYGDTFRQTTGGAPFDRWEFAAAPAKDLDRIADFFGLTLSKDGEEISHSMSTTVISPAGTVFKWYTGNEWKPADLVADATHALAQTSADDADDRSRAHISKGTNPRAG